MYYKEEFENLVQQFEEKKKEKLELPKLLRLIEKLEEKQLENENIAAKFLSLKEVLEKAKENYKINKSIFARDFRALSEYIRKEYGLVSKGFYTAVYMSLGMAIGTGIGVAFMSTNTVFFVIGIGAGLAIGSGVGAQKDKQAKEKGIVY